MNKKKIAIQNRRVNPHNLLINCTEEQIKRCNTCSDYWKRTHRLHAYALGCWKIYIAGDIQKTKEYLQKAAKYQKETMKITYAYDHNPPAYLGVIYFKSKRDANQAGSIIFEALKNTHDISVSRGCATMRKLYPKIDQWGPIVLNSIGININIQTKEVKT